MKLVAKLIKLISILPLVTAFEITPSLLVVVVGWTTTPLPTSRVKRSLFTNNNGAKADWRVLKLKTLVMAYCEGFIIPNIYTFN